MIERTFPQDVLLTIKNITQRAKGTSLHLIWMVLQLHSLNNYKTIIETFKTAFYV